MDTFWSIIGGWLLLSIIVGLLLGRFIRVGKGPSPGYPGSEISSEDAPEGPPPGVTAYHGDKWLDPRNPKRYRRTP